MRLAVIGEGGLLARRAMARLIPAHEIVTPGDTGLPGVCAAGGDPADKAELRRILDGCQLVLIDGAALVESGALPAIVASALALAPVAGVRRLVLLSRACAALEDRPALRDLADAERVALGSAVAATVLVVAPLLGPGVGEGAAMSRISGLLAGDSPPAPRRSVHFVDVRDADGAIESAIFRDVRGRLDLAAPPVRLAAFDARVRALAGGVRQRVEAGWEPALEHRLPLMDGGPAAEKLGFWTRPRARTLRDSVAWLVGVQDVRA